jgi:hypothetical protein
VICLVSGGLRSIAPSQKPARFVRIQRLPKIASPSPLGQTRSMDGRAEDPRLIVLPATHVALSCG